MVCERKEISASIMCADYLNLGRDINRLANAGIDWIHIDIMDGHFVPNITFGIDIVNKIKNSTNLKLDVHMLTYNPQQYFNTFRLDTNDLITFHYEAVDDCLNVVDCIKRKKVKAGIVLNPETDCRVLTGLIDRIDVIGLMMVKPGFSGRTIEKGMIEKIADTKEWIGQLGYETKIEVDGSVSFSLAAEMSRMGANIFVAGSSSIFNDKTNIEDGTALLRSIIE